MAFDAFHKSIEHEQKKKKKQDNSNAVEEKCQRIVYYLFWRTIVLPQIEYKFFFPLLKHF